MKGLRVINPGLFSTVQDLGRMDYQQFGMPVSGSTDKFAHRIANLLVGNDEGKAVLEMTIVGGQFVFECDADIAITGANMTPKLNESLDVGMWRNVRVKCGDRLTFSSAVNGCRCYLAVSGGLDIEPVMGSRSTYTRAGIGGNEGRILKKEDVLPLMEGRVSGKATGCYLSAGKIPNYKSQIELRVVLGPQEDAFTPQGIANFFSSVFRVSGDFDRMGYKLEGKKIEHVDSADIISDGIVAGAVQIPAHGNPIIMLSDCQTTGGYTKIAHVITSDLPKIAQAKAGDEIRFKAVDIGEAHEIVRHESAFYYEIKDELEKTYLGEDRNMKISVLGKCFQVKVNEIKHR